MTRALTALAALCLATSVAVADPPEDAASARRYHLTGMSESMVTSALLSTGLSTWSSPQSTQAFQLATYGVLYLHGHVFDAHRLSPWLEAATYAGIGVAATAVAGESVYHKRENLAEVVFGGLLGTASSTLFYLYQEKRYRNGRRAVGLDSLRLRPSVTSSSATLGLTFVW